MQEPEFLLDGARVLRYSMLEAQGGYRAVVEGIPVDDRSVSRLVIAEDLVEAGVYLLHCNSDWETVAASRFADADAAERGAAAAYSGVTPRWTAYRALTEEEERQVRTTREFLREIAG